MFVCLLIQEVEEVLDGRRDCGPRTQDTAEEIVDELLQSALCHTHTHTLIFFTSFQQSDSLHLLFLLQENMRKDWQPVNLWFIISILQSYILITLLYFYLHGQQPGQVDFSDGFNGGLVLHAAPLGLHFIQLFCWPHQMEHFIILQQSTSWKAKTLMSTWITHTNHLQYGSLRKLIHIQEYILKLPGQNK